VPPAKRRGRSRPTTSTRQVIYWLLNNMLSRQLSENAHWPLGMKTWCHSQKMDVLNISQRRQRRTEPWPQLKFREREIGVDWPCSFRVMRADRHADKQTDKHTYSIQYFATFRRQSKNGTFRNWIKSIWLMDCFVYFDKDEWMSEWMKDLMKKSQDKKGHKATYTCL